MKVKIISDESQFKALRQDWDTLLNTYSPRPLSLTYCWISAWWSCFGGDRQLHVVCIYAADKLVAIAPLMKERIRYRGLPTTALKLMANGKSPYADVLLDQHMTAVMVSEAIELLVSHALKELLIFAKIPERSYVYRYLTTGRHGLLVGVKTSMNTPILKIDQCWDSFYRQRSRKFRKSLNNKINKYAKENHSSIDHTIVDQGNYAILNEIAEVSKNSWKKIIDADFGSCSDETALFRRIIDDFGKDGAVHVWMMRVDGVAVAYEFHVIFDGISYPLRADYDERYKALSPGSILEYTILKSFFDEKSVSLYDSCADDYWYLRGWSDERRQQYDMEVFGDGLTARLLYLIEYGLIPMLRKTRNRVYGLVSRSRS